MENDRRNILCKMGGLLCGHATRHGFEAIGHVPRGAPATYNIPESAIRSVLEQRPLNVPDLVFLLRNWQIRELPADVWSCALDDDIALSELLTNVPDKVKALRTDISGKLLYERLCEAGKFSTIPASIIITTPSGMIALHYACKALDYRYVSRMVQQPNLFLIRDNSGLTPLDYLVRSTVERGSTKAVQTTATIVARLPRVVTREVRDRLPEGCQTLLQRAFI